VDHFIVTAVRGIAAAFGVTEFVIGATRCCGGRVYSQTDDDDYLEASWSR